MKQNSTNLTRLPLILMLWGLLMPLLIMAQKKVEVERLPDMTIPRSAHELFYINGELVAAGGHTSGFLPTPTAEYFRDGKWHLLQMVYTHDFGGSVVLKSGKVLLFGGSEKPIGIGQTYLAELYDPQNHSFNGFNSMQQKRAASSGLELDNGEVVIAGNWYHDDGIEVFDGEQRFTYVKDVAQQRSYPYIFQTAADDAIVFGFINTQGDTIPRMVVDRLKGDTLHVPLFDTWHPLRSNPARMSNYFIGDMSQGRYTYLLPVQDSTGQVAIAKVDNGMFSLLPTSSPVPMEGIGDGIEYFTLISDHRSGRAYLFGIDQHFASTPHQPHHYYFLSIDYAQASEKTPAMLALYYTDPLFGVPDRHIVVDDDGNLLMTGGSLEGSNFTPAASAYLLRFGKKAEVAEGGVNYWLIGGMVVLALLALLAYLIIRSRRHPVDAHLPQPVESTASADKELMGRISDLMDREQLYLNDELKLSDVAVRLNTNTRYISKCINVCEGCSFSGLLNRYRVEHAKRLLCERPDMKSSSVATASGFTSDQTFFRAFRAITGMTPKEWKARS